MPFCPCCQVLRSSGPQAPEGIQNRKPDRGRTEAGKPRTTQQNEEHNRTSRHDGFRCSQCIGVLPMLPANRERKPTRERGNEGRQRSVAEPATSPQAHKKGYPPLLQRAGSPSPHHKFAPKNQQKVALGRFEKIFGKIFRGNVSGERKTPCVVSTEGA